MQEFLRFCDDLPEQHFDAGSVIMSEGARTGILFILVEGRVEVCKGGFQVYVTSDPGAVFGELAALLDRPHSATVRTLVPCRAHIISEAAPFLRSHPDIALALSKVLAQRLYGITTYLADLKAQFEEHGGHLSMVDEVLVSMLHEQDDPFMAGSDRYTDPKI